MRKGIWQDFDGYGEIVEGINLSRKFGENYTAEQFSAEDYIRRLHPEQLDLRVIDIVEESASTKTLRLVARDKYLPPFLAGQYVALHIDMGGIRTARPYSISSAPNQIGFYDLTVRRMENGLVSNFLLDEVKTGDALQSSGPAGNFYFNPLVHEKTMVCIAGGSGITPFMSMIREIVECGLDRTVYLFHGSKTTGDIIFHSELMQTAEKFDNIHYIPVIEDPDDDYAGACGFMTGELIRDMVGNIVDKSFFVCGPQGMYDFCLPELETLGIPRRKLKQEMYGAPPHIWDYPGWPPDVRKEDTFTVHIKEGQKLTAAAGKPLQVSLEESGVALPSLCRSGECSLCRVKILSGKVFQPPGVLVRKSDRQFGYVHACMSYPLEDLEILL